MLDSPEELLRKIRLGEDEVLELKSAVRNKRVALRRDELADELAAMANSRGGVCVLGVDDSSREIEGIPIDLLDTVESFVREICNDSVAPPLTVHILRMELPDTRGQLQAVVKVEIPRSLFVHKSPGGYFRRQGSSKREMRPELLERLFQQRSQARLVRFDEYPVADTTPANLEETLWRRFLGPWPADPMETLSKLRLISVDETGTPRATVAGLLLCSCEPERWLPGSFIEAVHYRGVRQDSNYQVDARRITGPLDQQVDEALAFVRRTMTVAATKYPGRVDVPQFSIRAVFEAIVNAVAHRDYSIHGSKIRLFLFDDRLDLFSPGSLPNTVTVESMSLRQSTRNELITSLLARVPVEDERGELQRSHLMDRRGDGVPIIIDESRALSNRDPLFRIIDDAELRLTIWSAQLPNQGG